MRTLLKKWWDLPRAPRNPGVLWWDKWLAAAALVAVVVEVVLRPELQARWFGLVIGVAFAVLLVWRRVQPFATSAAVLGITVFSNTLGLINPEWNWEIFSAIIVLLFPYALFRWGSGREAMIGLGLMVVTYLLSIPATDTLGDQLGGAVVFFFPAFLGAEVRTLSSRRSAQVEGVRLKERGELARELHDTVAHHVSAIAIQAQAGKELAKTDPSAAVDALSTIESEASKTLSEMRAMVGALRDDSDPEMSPLAGVADLDALAEAAGDAIDISIDVMVDPKNLSPQVDSALYRLTQESITNTVRHARDATKVEVSIADNGSGVRLLVEDDGEPSIILPDAGFGLVGMEERARLLGGTFEAGPIPGGGWRVEAVLPRGGEDY